MDEMKRRGKTRRAIHEFCRATASPNDHQKRARSLARPVFTRRWRRRHPGWRGYDRKWPKMARQAQGLHAALTRSRKLAALSKWFGSSCDKKITPEGKVEKLGGLYCHSAMVSPRSPVEFRPVGISNMFSRSCNKPLCSWKTFRLFIVGLTATTLSACAQSPLVTNKTASLSASRQVSALRKRPTFATTKHTDEASNATYGVASFYSEGSQTASGEKFDAREMTAAHRTLPFGTHVRITNVTNGQSVTVRINDRGPFVPGRVVDVSPSAAKTIGITDRGIAKVKLEVVQ